MSRTAVVVSVVVLALVAALVVGLSQTGTSGEGVVDSSAPTKEEARKALAGAPAPLASLHAQASQLLPGDTADLKARLATLKGYPVVVNKWASWCGPCRLEFPFFQTVSVRMGKQVAFLGLDGRDNRPNAQRFLKQRPLSYPSYEDPKESIAADLKAGKFYPTTVFYTADGKESYVHQGGYTDAAALERDIRRYALG